MILDNSVDNIVLQLGLAELSRLSHGCETFAKKDCETMNDGQFLFCRLLFCRFVRLLLQEVGFRARTLKLA